MATSTLEGIIEDSMRSATSRSTTYLRVWPNAQGAEVTQLADIGPCHPNEAIGAKHTKPDDNGDRRCVYADWRLTRKGDELIVNFYSGISEWNQTTFPVSTFIENIAKTVALDLEKGAMRPIHAKAVFAAFRVLYAERAKKAFEAIGGVDQAIEGMLPIKRDSWRDDSKAKASAVNTLDAIKAATPLLELAAKAVALEDLTINVSDPKELARKINTHLAGTERRV